MSTPLARTLQQAQQHYRTGRLAPARKLITQILRVLPRHAEAQVLLQRIDSPKQPSLERQQALLACYQAGTDPLTSEIAIHFFIQDYPDHPLGWQLLGAILQDIGKRDEALAIQQASIAKFPTDANCHNNLAQALLAAGRFREALDSARKALRLKPGFAQARRHEEMALAGLREAA